MKKLLSVLLATAALAAIPVHAQEPTRLSDDQVLPEQVDPIEEAIPGVDGDQANIERYRRSCPWGYHLQGYRVRIGPISIVRYRCVRNRW